MRFKLAEEFVKEIAGKNAKKEVIEDTPKRVMKIYAELCDRGDKTSEELMSKTFEAKSDDMIVKTKMPFFSLCEHHIIPFFGLVSIAYIPHGRVVGLSKLPRLVKYYAKGLNIQEDLTANIADAIIQHLKPKGVMVVIRGQHLCEQMRGAETVGTVTITSAVRGIFMSQHVKEEALELMR